MGDIVDSFHPAELFSATFHVNSLSGKEIQNGSIGIMRAWFPFTDLFTADPSVIVVRLAPDLRYSNNYKNESYADFVVFCDWRDDETKFSTGLGQ
jgi:hypothetical protein